MGDTHGRLGRTPVYIVIGLLWLLSAALGFVSVYYFHELAILIYAAFIGKEYSIGVLVGQASAIIAALIALGAIIVTGEYHLKHAGQRKSWQILAWMLGIEVLIIVVGIITTGV